MSAPRKKPKTPVRPAKACESASESRQGGSQNNRPANRLHGPAWGMIFIRDAKAALQNGDLPKTAMWLRRFLIDRHQPFFASK